MYNTTKALPKALQLRMQKQIFKVVLEAEEELLGNSLRPPATAQHPLFRHLSSACQLAVQVHLAAALQVVLTHHRVT
jgi:hypothetical protein